MTSVKYIGLDVHKETISIAVMNSAGKLLMESFTFQNFLARRVVGKNWRQAAFFIGACAGQYGFYGFLKDA